MPLLGYGIVMFMAWITYDSLETKKDIHNCDPEPRHLLAYVSNEVEGRDHQTKASPILLARLHFCAVKPVTRKPRVAPCSGKSHPQLNRF